MNAFGVPFVFSRLYLPHRWRGAARSALRGVILILACVACHNRDFDPKNYPNTQDLFAVGLHELGAKHYENATKVFEELTRALPARSPLLPASYFYLGEAQEGEGDHLLAAQSYTRVADAFPEDSLAPLALLRGGVAYAKMWRRPQLDPEYGQTAMTTLQSLLALYPDSPLVPQAKTTIARLDDMFAQKDDATGYHYLKRKAYDSAIIYFKDVIRLHPNTPAARDAYLHLYDTYAAIRYRDDAKDLCDAMRKNYPNDREVVVKCGSGSSAAASTPHT